jgi:hypothetical protein
MPQDANTLPDDGRLIPIVLGVVGHRDLPWSRPLELPLGA